ncbi:MAG: response regulator transcription factor [bacterium]
MTVKVMIADDHAVFREGLREILEGDGAIDVIGEAEDSYQVLDQLPDPDFEVLVLDISMPGPSASTVAEKVLDECQFCSIVVLTMHDEEYYLKEFLQIGVKGFLNKKQASDHVIEAIKAADNGNRYIDPELADKAVSSLADRPGNKEASRLDELTDRQQEVCELLAYGHTNTEVAEKLNISPRTVESHRAEIMDKLGFDNRADLVRFALDRGLISSED